VLNTVKKQDLLYPYSFFGRGCYMINPPKQNGQFEVNFDGFTASAPLPKKLEAKIKVLTQSIVS
jgi:hypothetical protein